PTLLLLLLVIGLVALAVWAIARDFGGLAGLLTLLRLALFFASHLPRLAPALRLAADGLDEASNGLRQATTGLRKVSSTVSTAAHQIATFELPAFEPQYKKFSIPTGPGHSEEVDLVVGLTQRPDGVQPLAGVGALVEGEAARIDGSLAAVSASTVEIGKI